MDAIQIPVGYNRVMPYLILKGAADFLTFAKEVLGAEEKAKHLKEDGTIMHAEISIGDSMIMVTESSALYGVENAGMFVYVANADDAYNKALKLNATSIMPVADQSYGRSGGIKDPFGNTWWITTHK
jgi:uncharacterized glyoxalase superfamily protein PhnB